LDTRRRWRADPQHLTISPVLGAVPYAWASVPHRGTWQPVIVTLSLVPVEPHGKVGLALALADIEPGH